ncbi:DHH family phosphoesterase [Clostridium estertheticum]|uniref:DHH family phosphoesterase n=1 Tax=Clostridium estertheticum TaxID=238834 RepID=UPI0013EEDDBF|nr:DHH family phosphoesterase [Clostridium estertheticum]MBZ9608107.1 DHH family phosphoesterase [Clostridium estertheticum]
MLDYLKNMQMNKNSFIDYNMYNPFLLKGMEAALYRVVKAINEREKIVLYGFYDVDSIAAISLLMLVLKFVNADVEYFIPSELSENRDLNEKDINNHIKYLGPGLIITLGCGINSFSEIESCKYIGIDVIVTDFHEPIKNVPDTIVVDPQQKGCNYPFKGLCASGLTFKLAQAISSYYKMKSINKYMDLVMIGTSYSKTKIESENKIIAEEGIKQLKCTNNYGICALLKTHNIKIINEDTVLKLALKVMPTINPVGRMDNAKIVVELFITTDKNRALQISKYLDNELKNNLVF